MTPPDAGLAGDLGYRHRRPNPAQALLRRLAGTPAGARVLARVLPHLDDLVGRASGGRHSAPGLLTGLAVLELTTTGRVSGRRRTSHLIATPYAGTLALIGTNFGQEHTPAWARNLESEPRASVGYRGTTREVVARAATARETEEIFERAASFYPGYGRYRRRIGGRRPIPVFVLEPVGRRG